MLNIKREVILNIKEGKTKQNKTALISFEEHVLRQPRFYASDKTTAKNMNHVHSERLVIKLVKMQQNMETSNKVNL